MIDGWDDLESLSEDEPETLDYGDEVDEDDQEVNWDDF